LYLMEEKMKAPSRTLLTFAIASVAVFMTALDNLVVTIALPAVQRDLDAGLDQLEWTVNAYTLTFAVLLLTGAALGERFGRRRLFVIGLAVFTAGSAAAALAPSLTVLLVARAVQGAGGAIVTPLSLTLLTSAVPAERRGLAIGAWSGVSGLGVGLGPVVGGAIVEGISWHWIFWLNVPIGALAILLAQRSLPESRASTTRLDIPGVALAGLGLLGVVYGLVRGNQAGWSSGAVLGSLAAGALLIGCFVRWELRAATPMLPMRLFRSRAFSATNAVSFLMYLGLMGSAFLLAQYLQAAHGYSPLQAGIRTLPWTAMPLFVAPLAGALSDRIGGRPLMIAGLALQVTGLAAIAAIASPSVPYGELAAGFFVAGVGMAFVFAPVTNMVLGAVAPSEIGQASGANNAVRELGGVFGVTVLAAVFNATGSYASPAAFVDGLGPAIFAGAAAMALAGLVALLLPSPRRRRASASGPEPRRARAAVAQA
jgi:EmrB/QacA subfamily drug resistance transporter